VDSAQLAAIANSTFDPNNFPKLLRDDEARQRHKLKAVDGILIDIESGKQKVITTETKLISSFPNIQTFMSAFNVYSSIRP